MEVAINKIIISNLSKPQLELLVSTLPNYVNSEWKHITNLIFEYCGSPKAQLTIPYSEDSWRKTYLEFASITTIKAIDKDYLKEEERQSILLKFYSDILKPFCDKNGIRTLTE